MASDPNSRTMVAKARLASRIADLDPIRDYKLYEALEEVFNAALPMLSRLRYPSLLLPGKLQTVVKAQRIFLQPEEQYEGVWHRDGKNEDIVAAVLYYYGVSSELQGGQLEFFDSQPIGPEFWVDGDCCPTALSAEDFAVHMANHAYQKVPLQPGTMVVFSNFQLLHRVLRMWHDASSNDEASRDFVVFFVVDQRTPLMSTTEYLSDAQHRQCSEETRINLRAKLLEEQLTPYGQFGASSAHVYSTGNGSVALLECAKQSNLFSLQRILSTKSRDRSGFYNLLALNQCPPQGRGISWAMEEQRAKDHEADNDDDDDDDDGRWY
jgi:hypothetical protein